jgi:hypothetical protein
MAIFVGARQIAKCGWRSLYGYASTRDHDSRTRRLLGWIIFCRASLGQFSLAPKPAFAGHTLMPFGFHLTMDTLPSGVLPTALRPARNYPRFRIWRPSSGRQRDFNPPEQRAAQHTVCRCPTPRRRACGSYGLSLFPPVPITRDVPEVSRFSCLTFLGVPGVYDYAGPSGMLAFALLVHVAFRLAKDVGALIARFRSSIPRPPIPLFTLHGAPHDA